METISNLTSNGITISTLLLLRLIFFLFITIFRSASLNPSFDKTSVYSPETTLDNLTGVMLYTFLSAIKSLFFELISLILAPVGVVSI